MSNKIMYSRWVFSDREIKSGSVHLAMSLLSSSLEANTITVNVICDDPSILKFQRDQKLSYLRDDALSGIFYVQSIKRVRKTEYEISGTSAVGLLTEGQHYGGIYTGQTVADVVPSICGTIPFYIKSNLKDIKLYGWLPIASPRDNLSQVLFAIGAGLKTDLDGILRIERLWSGTGHSTPKSRIYNGASVDYEAAVTEVRVTEHQYLEGTEEVSLFEGVTQDGQVIVFDDPMHHLTASGVTILESGANYAKVSGGGCTLTGKSYIHNTRQISREVAQAPDPNIKTVTDATLISVTNSDDAVERMRNYYQWPQRLGIDTIHIGEKPGDITSAYHPYDESLVASCVESEDINLSHTLKSKETSVVGFKPIIQDSDSNVQIISKDMTYTVPAGVTTLRVVLIGGGQGGWSGNPGEDAPDQQSLNENGVGEEYNVAYTSTEGGHGGAPGNGGQGGKIYQVSVDVTPSQTFAVKIGQGGAGGAAGYASVKGSDGAATTFGPYSSASGSNIDGGFLETVSRVVYAGPGGVGPYKGGQGAGSTVGDYSQGWPEFPGDTIIADGKSYVPGGRGSEIIDTASYGAGYAWKSFGGGPAYGANGQNGLNNGSVEAYDINTSNGKATSVRAYASSGGAGADALPPPQATVYGQGGAGGNGGGGGGSSGTVIARAYNTASHDSMHAFPATPAKGGKGSAGGKGGNGCVILYYSSPAGVKHGPIVGRDKKLYIERIKRRFVV